jgi:RNA polymerase sigma-70 factor (ECF subfamily)
VEPSGSQLPDRELVQQTLAGSKDAFGLLAVRYARTVRAVLISRAGLHRELDDMVQEVLLRAYRGLGRLQSADSFPSYLHKIAANLATDQLRRRGRQPLSLAELDLDPPQLDAPTGPDEDRLARLRRQIGRLPETLREVVLLFYFQEISYADIARVLGISVAAVNQRLNRARQRLRAAFGVASPAGEEEA